MMDEYTKREAVINRIKEYASDVYGIDLDDPLQFAGKSVVENFCEGLYEATELVDNIPAADVAPVVHGRWEWLGPNGLVTDCMCGTCSACKVRSKYIVNTMLCPNCGAKMDGGDNDGAD